MTPMQWSRFLKSWRSTERMTLPKYIFRKYPDRWADYQKYLQEKEYVKAIQKTITEQAAKASQQLQSEQRTATNSKVSYDITPMPQQQKRNLWLLTGIIACMLFPPLLIWVVYEAVTKNNYIGSNQSSHL